MGHPSRMKTPLRGGNDGIYGGVLLLSFWLRHTAGTLTNPLVGRVCVICPSVGVAYGFFSGWFLRRRGLEGDGSRTATYFLVVG